MMLLAHPLTEPAGLPVSPLVMATVSLCLLAVADRLARPRTDADRDEDVGSARAENKGSDDSVGDGDRLSAPRWVTRVIGVALLVLAIVAGRLGNPAELENIAPALVVGAAWPVLLIVSAVVGRVWPWLNPWDTLARFAAPLAGDDPPENPRSTSVVWALPGAAALAWYLYGFDAALSPRAVSTALAVYTLVTVSGCLLLGRRQWLARAEVFTLLFGWTARLRRSGLSGWVPPRNADLVLGILAGGGLFWLLHNSQLRDDLAMGTGAALDGSVGLAVSCAVAMALLRAAGRRKPSRGTVTAAAVPTVAAILITGALARSRLLTSLQLLPALSADPLGRGWTPFGVEVVVNPTPLVNPSLALLQVAVLTAGGVVSAVIARRRAGEADAPERGPRGPALLVSCVFVATAVLAVALT
ncbi:MAG: hypothetical protein M3425_07735 [Actinomycetota bacterium]|nr:hypothetical protein [Actinomycetota bacterium]